MPRTTHPELHRTERIGWLRAAVLGANDGLDLHEQPGRGGGRGGAEPRSEVLSKTWLR